MILLQPRFFYYYASSHFAKHLIKHAVSAKIKNKNAICAPVMIAPIILVATKVMPKSITDVNIVPKIAVNKTVKTGQIQLFWATPEKLLDVIKVIARYKTAIPKATHKNTGVNVITAVVRKTAAITPIIILAIIATTEQFDLQEQTDIFSPPDTIYENISAE